MNKLHSTQDIRMLHYWFYTESLFLFDYYYRAVFVSSLNAFLDNNESLNIGGHISSCQLVGGSLTVTQAVSVAGCRVASVSRIYLTVQESRFSSESPYAWYFSLTRLKINKLSLCPNTYKLTLTLPCHL